ncbi:MAG: TetR/AcrR family transcriptional regulator [Deltaproteobacteria bacterium]|nr:TetR/AcrR family transcriptional regulator [Deltaproteobacteria bacterium]MBW2696806.1 TetR/AcrR family transcriptional regulator [Deltaproteobacteria bacterium]
MSAGQPTQSERPSPALRADAVATRARIVSVAERLFAERGIDATSLAEINKAAGQRNRSAVQYHFGNKEGVVHAILDKHTPGIEQRRHLLLDDIEAAGPPRLRDLAEALVGPVADKLDDTDGGVEFLRINAQLIGHPAFPLLDLHTRRVNRGADRLQRLMAAAAPDLPQPLWISRWLLMIGLLFHGLADFAQLLEQPDPERAAPPRGLFVSNLVDAIVALMLAPVSDVTTRQLGKKEHRGVKS